MAMTKERTLSKGTIALCVLILVSAEMSGGCRKKGSETGYASYRYVTDQEKQVLELKLSKLVEALRKEDVHEVQRLMHSSRQNEFTIDDLRHVEEFRGDGWFKNLGSHAYNAPPSIGKVRCASDKSLVNIDGLGVTAFFKEIDGEWYFDGWAK